MVLVCKKCGSTRVHPHGSSKGSIRHACKDCGSRKIPQKMFQDDIIVIADTQVDKHSPLEHLKALANYINAHQPKYLIHIGDHWDMPSLSSYANAKDAEGRRLNDDIESGLAALKIINNGILNKGIEKYFIMGNHENRLDRFISSQPILDGFFNLPAAIEREGWEVVDFLKPLWINDICFIHYLPNPESSRAISGSIDNKLNKISHSFVHGHQQKYQYGRRQNMQGKPHFGVCAGSFYIHDEDYRGANNTEIRGFTHLRGFTNRYGFKDYDVEFISLERLLEQCSF